MILLIDNYDSFVYNLARYMGELGMETRVVRNDKINVPEIARLKPRAIVLSPGPCAPDQAGVCLDAIKGLGHKIPILGVCLGHQAIGQAYGGRITRSAPMHGRSSLIHHNGTGVFAGLPDPLKVGRYHSLIVANDELPHDLIPTAHAADGAIMALRHARHPVAGVQFHPESILTDHGHQILRNFMSEHVR